MGNYLELCWGKK